MGPFPHSDDSEGAVVIALFLRDPVTVVGHGQHDVVLVLFQTNLCPGGSGVTGNVGQGFLKNPEEGRRQVSVQFQVVGREYGRAGDAGAVLKIGGLPFDGGRQTQIIQQPRPKLRRDAMDRLNGRIGQCGHLPHLLVKRFCPGRKAMLQPGDVHLEGRQGLPQFIMDFSGDPCPFLFADRLLVGGEIAQLLTGVFQLSLRLDSFGDILIGHDDSAFAKRLADP